VREETGLRSVHLHPRAPRPFDVDVHDIPARPGEPAHEHLDLRYLVVAEDDVITRAQEEAADLRWFAWSDLEPLGLDQGLRRGLAKARRQSA
jgi:ADP-ribose pyrophosphatase YjhB (NUDIX family)